MAPSTTGTETAQEQSAETQTGLDEHVAATLAYVVGFLSGIVMLLVESDNDRVRFHAAQSIVVFGGIFLASIAVSFLQVGLGFVPVIGTVLGALLSLLSFALWLGGFIVWLYLLIKTYQKENPRIPIAAGIAEGLV